MSRNSKLTDTQKEEIRKLRNESKLAYSILAEMYHVSPATIMRICRPDSYERQLAANRKYHSENYHKINVQRSEQFRHFYFAFHVVNDREVIDRLESQDNKQDYVRQLILRDMKSKGQEKEMAKE